MMNPERPPPAEASSNGGQDVEHLVTELLLEAGGGNRLALDRLMPLVYEELRAIANQRLRKERADHTLNTTALVHEAYLKLVDQDRVQWQNRAHFCAVASQAMRRILINYANARKARKRGGLEVAVALNEVSVPAPGLSLDDLLELDLALQRLREFNERGEAVVAYRFFGGLSYEEIAEVLDTSVATVRRSWSAARAWLRKEVGPLGSEGSSDPLPGSVS